jgi:hypothetical protein
MGSRRGSSVGGSSDSIRVVAREVDVMWAMENQLRRTVSSVQERRESRKKREREEAANTE